MNLRESIRMIEHFLLLERMTPREAVAIFAQHGVAAEGMSADELKKAYRNLVVKLHPDHGGNDDDLKYVNAAYDVLKAGGAPSASPGSTRTRYADRPPEGDDIYRNDHGRPWYHDIRKVQAHLSKKARETGGGREMTIWNFDGHFFRGVMTVTANEGMFEEMADLMRKWDRFNDSRAVFVTERSRPDAMLLIWSDGVLRSPPIPMEHESFNSNPGNDQRFVRNLPDMLDKIRDGEA